VTGNQKVSYDWYEIATASTARVSGDRERHSRIQKKKAKLYVE
jgi:hypothetical protein